MTPSTEATDPVFISERPDWGQSLMIDRTHATQVFISEDGTETRQQRLTTSKVDCSYTVDALTPTEAFARELSILDELLAPVVVPMWPYSVAVAGQEGAILTVGDSLGLYPFRVGGWVFVEDDNGEAFYQLTDVDVPENQLTISGDFPQFSNGTIYPCITGVRKDGNATIKTTHTDTIETVAVAETTGAGVAPLVANMLGDLPVFSFPPNFDEGISFKYGSKQNAAKSVGNQSIQFPQLRAQAAMSRTYTCRTKAEALEFAAFWEAMGGQCGVFWTPSWRNQLAIQGSPRAGAMTLTLSQSVNYQTRFLSVPNPNYASGAYLYLHDFTNPPQLIKVTGSVVNGNGTETLNLATAIPLNYTLRRFICGIVVLARFAADTLEETWTDENSMEAKVGLLEVTNFRPDAEPDYYVAGWGQPVVSNGEFNALQNFPIPPYQVISTESPTSWSATGLPAGLAIDEATGIISGTTDVATGEYNVTVTATNESGRGEGTIAVTVLASVIVVFEAQEVNDLSSYASIVGIEASFDGGDYEAITFGSPGELGGNQYRYSGQYGFHSSVAWRATSTTGEALADARISISLGLTLSQNRTMLNTSGVEMTGNFAIGSSAPVAQAVGGISYPGSEGFLPNSIENEPGGGLVPEGAFDLTANFNSATLYTGILYTVLEQFLLSSESVGPINVVDAFVFTGVVNLE